MKFRGQHEPLQICLEIKCDLHVVFMGCHFFLLFCSDKRESRCYLHVEKIGGQNQCSQEMGSPVTKSTCCCSVGRAWGARCELCPDVDTEEYKTLCPGGSGYRPNTLTVSTEIFPKIIASLYMVFE